MTSIQLGLIDDIVIFIVLFLVHSLRNSDETVIQGANSRMHDQLEDSRKFRLFKFFDD